MCVAAFIAIASMFVYGMVFFPLFSSLAIGSVFSYGLGTLYVWMMSIVQIFRLVEMECNVTAVSSISTLNSFSLRFYLAQTPNACLPYHIEREEKEGVGGQGWIESNSENSSALCVLVEWKRCLSLTIHSESVVFFCFFFRAWV